MIWQTEDKTGPRVWDVRQRRYKAWGIWDLKALEVDSPHRRVMRKNHT